jgi:hypothetical protein
MFKTPIVNFRWVTMALLLAMILVANPVSAHVLENIDVTERDTEAVVVIHFTERIQYMRHVPKDEGRILRVYFLLAGNTSLEEGLMQVSRSTRKSKRVPGMTVVYPELSHAMLITFSKPTKFLVKPGVDEKSIVITIPIEPEEHESPKEAAAIVSVVVPEEKKSEPAPDIHKETNAVLPVEPIPTPVKVVQVEASGGEVAEQKKAGDQLPAQKQAGAGAEEKAVESKEPGTTELVGNMATIPAGPSAEEMEAQARDYFSEANKALTEKDFKTAINRLNHVLGMSANQQTEAAQALIGEAREMNGEIRKAKAEYELYLKLFPAGPAAAHVQERLAALTSADKGKMPKQVVQRPKAKDTGPTPWMFYGNVSVNQYRGSSEIQSSQTTPASLIPTTQHLTMVDQNSLITSINLNARHRDATSDTRLVFRDTDQRNLLSPSRSYNRVYSAYGEHTDRDVGYFVRGGRQNPSGSGVMSRFDGITGYYSIIPELRVGAVYGDAAEFNVPYKRSFYGLNVEHPAEPGKPGVNLYMIEQTLDGYLDRRAVGSEVRYFDGALSGFATLDYDLLYKDLNIAMLQGNYMSEGGDNNYYFMYDRRRSPSYGLTNALGLPGFNTIKSMVDQFGLDEMRRMSKGNTALAEMFSVGVTHRLSSDWQIGGDYRTSNISGSHPVQLLSQLCPDFVPGDQLSIQNCTPNGQPITVYCSSIDIVNGTCTTSTQSSGATQSYSLQLLASNLFAPNAVGVGNLTMIEGPTFSGQSVNLSYVLPINSVWRLDGNLSYYTQHDNANARAERISPSLKLTYQWGKSLFLEGQIGQDVSTNSSPTSNDKNTRNYLYSGMRWDLN